MEKIAIIGTGIAGLACAHFLQDHYDLTLFEKNDYVGGHTNTITVDEEGKEIFIDTGFMVFNPVTYPHLTKLFQELNVPVKKTSMSFSVQHLPSGLEYSGSGLNGLFAQRKNIFSASHIRMLRQIARFNLESVNVLDDSRYDEYTLDDYVREKKFGEDMLWKYLLPMSAAVWSIPADKMPRFPAKTLIRFFYNHGFLGLNTQHQWYTVVNGSRTYRDLLVKPFKEKIRISNLVLKVERENGKAIVHSASAPGMVFDKVILACHGDEALALLSAPTSSEKNILEKFSYQANTVTLHTDEAVMPHTRRAWSSWNYRIEKDQWASTIYWMNSLQQVSEKKNYFVSINDPGNIAKNKIIRTLTYTHPVFDLAAVKAQNDLYTLNEPGPVYFCGSYFGYGFHEDALVSAMNLCKIISTKY